jgi:uncharacterized Zn-finger protein
MTKPPAPPPPEIIEVGARRVSCDGGGGALGHPRIYIEIGEEGFAECGYCDRRFVYKPELAIGGSGH